MLKQYANPEKTGVCCINMGWDVPDKNIRIIVHTVDEYRNNLLNTDQDLKAIEDFLLYKRGGGIEKYRIIQNI